MDITFIGHVTLDVKENTSDNNEVDDNISYQPGGGVFYGSIAAATLGATPNVITCYNPEDSPLLSSLNQINFTVIPSVKTTTMKNVYIDGKANQRVSMCLFRANSFSESDLSTNKLSNTIILSPLVNGEFPEQLIPVLAKSCHTLALDVQGYTRHVVDQRMHQQDWPLKAEFLNYINILKVDEDEIRVLTGQSDVEEGMRMVGEWGLRKCCVPM
ncbi:hypothetical protein GEMRC1_010293 [Eukaryota sp. GEM-RC1]